MRTAAGLVLHLNPLFDSMGFQIFQLFNKPDVMRNPVDDVDREKAPETGAREFAALEAPRHLVLFGAATKTVAAIPARRKDVVGETAVAADFLDRKTGFFGSFFQIDSIPVPRSQVSWTSAAIDSADPDQFLCLLSSHPFPSLTLLLAEIATLGAAAG